jgi:DNA polymerase III sliding clamp (beta) subunit (PCNA family)
MEAKLRTRDGVLELLPYYDLGEMAVCFRVPCAIEEYGEMILPLNILEPVVQGPNERYIHIGSDDLSVVKVESSTEKIKVYHDRILNIGPAEIFMSQGQSVGLEASAFARVATYASKMASTDAARPFLTGVLIQPASGKVRISASNGCRLSRSKIISKKQEFADMIVPAPTMRLAASICAAHDAGFVSIASDGENVAISIDDIATVSSRVIPGKYPQTEFEKGKHSVSIYRESLLAACRLVKTLGLPDDVELIFDGIPFSLILRATKTGFGECDISVGTDNKFMPSGMAIRLNVNFLTDCLEDLTERFVIMEFSDPHSPVAFYQRQSGMVDEHATHIMPMRRLKR